MTPRTASAFLLHSTIFFTLGINGSLYADDPPAKEEKKAETPAEKVNEAEGLSQFEAAILKNYDNQLADPKITPERKALVEKNRAEFLKSIKEKKQPPKPPAPEKPKESKPGAPLMKTAEEEKKAAEAPPELSPQDKALLEQVEKRLADPQLDEKERKRWEATKADILKRAAKAKATASKDKPAEKAMEKSAAVAKEETKKDKKGDEKKGAKEGKKLAWRPNYTTALAEAKNTGRTLLIQFFHDSGKDAKKHDDDIFQNPEVVSLVATTFIPVKVNFDKGDIAEKLEVKSAQTTAIVRSNEEVVARIQNARDAATFLAELKKAQAKIGELEPLAGPERLQKEFDQAEKDMQEGRFNVAYKAFKKIADRDDNLVEVKKSREELLRIDTQADQRLDEIKEMVAQKDYLEAANLLNKFQSDFEGTPAIAKSVALEKSMEKDPTAKGAVRKAEAEQLFDQAAADLKKKNYGAGIAKLKTLVSKYPDQEKAKHAQWRLDKLKEDESFMRKARDEEAKEQSKKWLSLARTWKRNRQPAKANAYYKKIISTYPGTTFAKQAQREMEE